MNDADWLRTVQREKSQEDVDRIEAEKDRRRGPYVPHHHRVYYGESGH